MKYGDRVLINGRLATYIYPSGEYGVVVRYEDEAESRVVPLRKIIEDIDEDSSLVEG